MSPRRLSTRTATSAEAVGRRRIAEKYLEAAELIATEDGTAINVCVGLAVLAGIAAGDALCISGLGARYAGQDHAAATELLSRMDPALGSELRKLVDLKPSSHYGESLLSERQRARALRAASTLVEAARARTS